VVKEFWRKARSYWGLNDHFCCPHPPQGLFQRVWVGRTTHKNCPFMWGLDPISYTWFPGPTPVSPKRHLDRFSRFCRTHKCDQQTHTRTHIPTTLFHRNSPHLMQCMGLGLITIIPMTMMFMVLSRITIQPLWEFTRFVWWMQTDCLVAVNPQTNLTKPIDLGRESVGMLLQSTSNIAIY